MGKGIFITATGTDIGKTYITGLMTKKLREAGYHAGYYKAALSGAEITENGLIPGDAEFVNRIGNLGENINNMVSYCYQSAVSPHLASKVKGNPVELSVIKKSYEKVASKYDYVTMEGSGGIICPIRFDEKRIMLTDIIQELKLTTLLIADAGLGTINATVLSIEYMKQKGIKVKGIILNHFHAGDRMEEDNKDMIEILTGIPVIACVKDNDENLAINPVKLSQIYE